MNCVEGEMYVWLLFRNILLTLERSNSIRSFSSAKLARPGSALFAASFIHNASVGLMKFNFCSIFALALAHELEQQGSFVYVRLTTQTS
jgi:hypothetical protein